jgi:hypothetical protein
MWCTYSQESLISNYVCEVSSVGLICANCVGMVVGVTVEQKVNFISSFSFIVKDSWFESEVGRRM